MNALTDSSFRLTASYLLPGFILLESIGFVSPTVRTWLATSSEGAPTAGGFVYATLGSLALGLILSTVRWLLIDSLHHATGIRPPVRDYSKLQDQVAAFNVLVTDHYSYYKFHANMLIALALGFPIWRLYTDGPPFPSFRDALFVVLEIILFVGSRDTLWNYYSRLRQVL